MNQNKIYIASMNHRGKWALPLDEKSIKINVTSAQSTKSKNRIDFSPMTPIPGSYKGFWNFESYWQSGKVFEDIPHEISKQWWLNNKEPKRRYPNSKYKKVLFASWKHIQKLDYIESRKKIYVPEYAQLIQNKEQFIFYKNEYAKGKSFTIYDFDGPRLENGEPTCLEVNQEMLIQKINDPTFPFGHGYIVASLLANIPITTFS